MDEQDESTKRIERQRKVEGEIERGRDWEWARSSKAAAARLGLGFEEAQIEMREGESSVNFTEK
jgi:hypothetical protein